MFLLNNHVLVGNNAVALRLLETTPNYPVNKGLRGWNGSKYFTPVSEPSMKNGPNIDVPTTSVHSLTAYECSPSVSIVGF